MMIADVKLCKTPADGAEAIAVICQYLRQHGARLEVVSLHVVHLDFSVKGGNK